MELNVLNLIDEHERVLWVRGVNVCGHSKSPVKSHPLQHDRSLPLHDPCNVSFVGRPFHLNEVDEHFSRLRGWGLTFLRVLVTWQLNTAVLEFTMTDS